jgi:protein-tyrosine phosphatase
MTQISPHLLWVGHAGDGRDYAAVFRNGIRALVQLSAEDPPERPPRELVYVRVPLIDGAGNDLEHVRLAVEIVTHLLRRRIPTLVFCGGGMSRSPAVTAATIALVHGKDFDDCLREVSRQKPVDLSPGLWTDLRGVLDETVRRDG